MKQPPASLEKTDVFVHLIVSVDYQRSSKELSMWLYLKGEEADTGWLLKVGFHYVNRALYKC